MNIVTKAMNNGNMAVTKKMPAAVAYFIALTKVLMAKYPLCFDVLSKRYPERYATIRLPIALAVMKSETFSALCSLCHFKCFQFISGDVYLIYSFSCCSFDDQGFGNSGAK